MRSMCCSLSRHLLAGWLILALSVAGHAAERPLEHLFPVEEKDPVVLFFVASDCPISNRSIPEMLRLQQVFAPQHVRFWFIYPNVTESAATIRIHRQQYGIGSNVDTDSNGKLARLTGAKATPEAAILVHNGAAMRTVYAGRIDDRNLSLGVERPVAQRHDLEAAISHVLTGQPVEAPKGPLVGCYFVTSK